MLRSVERAANFVRLLFHPHRYTWYCFSCRKSVVQRKEKVDPTLMTKKELLAEAEGSEVVVDPDMDKEQIAQAINAER